MNHASLLATWHADPRSPEEAVLLARKSESHLMRHPANRHTCFIATLTQLICEWWLGEIERESLERAFIDARTKRHRALGHLVVGQLLMSRKLSGAMQYLDKGLDYADGLLKPDDYFTVYNRHNDLRVLPLSDTGQTPNPLTVLLNEARVIQQLNSDAQGWSKDDWPNQYSMP